MKAIVQRRYGAPDVLRLDDVPIPTPRADEVRVRVHAASVNAGDGHLMRGTPLLVRLMVGGLFRPKIRTPGVDVAGRVEAVGSDVRQFRPGDAVIGDLSEHGFGGFAEWITVPESALVPKPTSLSFEEAAALPVSGLAALQGLRDNGGIRPGMTVLINGASGGVGSFAVQIAKSYGTIVTAVGRTEKLDLLRSLGADRVVDYTREDVTRLGESFDLILDTAAHRSPLAYLPILKPSGTYVVVGGQLRRVAQAALLRPLVRWATGKRLETLISRPTPADLRALVALVESGAVRPAIDRRFRLDEVPEALRYLEAGRARGKVVVTVSPLDEADAKPRVAERRAPIGR